MLTAGLLLVEWFVVTEHERVEAALYGIAAALEADDVPGVVSHLSPTVPALQVEAQARLEHVRIREVVIGDLKISFNKLASPPAATATFLGRLNVDVRRGGPLGNVVGRFKVSLRKEDDRWLVRGYEFRK